MTIVECAKTFGCRNYQALNGDYQWTTSIKSLFSYVRSKGFEEGKCVMLIKK